MAVVGRTPGFGEADDGGLAVIRGLYLLGVLLAAIGRALRAIDDNLADLSDD